MIPTLTPETAALERQRILDEVRMHRRAAARRLRDLDRLEEDCRRVGIRLIREPARDKESEADATRTDPHPR